MPTQAERTEATRARLIAAARALFAERGFVATSTEEILEAHGKRLRHVHLHDNKGGQADLHLPLGTGTVDVCRSVRALRKCGYDGTITLEVFTPDRHHLLYSRDLLRKTWNECGGAAAAQRA